MRTAKVDTQLYAQLEGKTPTQKDKILRKLAVQGIQLPEGRTATERQIIAKIRVDFDLPPEPKSLFMKNKHAKAADAGLLLPLQGKTLEEKERILKGLLHMGIPLPDGATPSSKALVIQLKTNYQRHALMPSIRIRNVNHPSSGKQFLEKDSIVQQNLLQPKVTKRIGKLMDKSPNYPNITRELKTLNTKKNDSKVAECELLPVPLTMAQEQHYPPKIKNALDKRRIPIYQTKQINDLKYNTDNKVTTYGSVLPEGYILPGKKQIPKLRVNVDLPPKPKSATIRRKLKEAADARLLIPLQDKLSTEKERILRPSVAVNISFSKGKSESVSALTKYAFNHLESNQSGPDENLLRTRLRENKANLKMTPIENECVNNVFKLNLKSTTTDMHDLNGGDAGLFEILEGISSIDKENILQILAGTGVLLPEGRTESEKNLILKVKTRRSHLSPRLIQKEEMCVLVKPTLGFTSSQGIQEPEIKNITTQVPETNNELKDTFIQINSNTMHSVPNEQESEPEENLTKAPVNIQNVNSNSVTHTEIKLQEFEKDDLPKFNNITQRRHLIDRDLLGIILNIEKLSFNKNQEESDINNSRSKSVLQKIISTIMREIQDDEKCLNIVKSIKEIENNTDPRESTMTSRSEICKNYTSEREFAQLTLMADKTDEKQRMFLKKALMRHSFSEGENVKIEKSFVKIIKAISEIRLKIFASKTSKIDKKGGINLEREINYHEGQVIVDPVTAILPVQSATPCKPQLNQSENEIFSSVYSEEMLPKKSEQNKIDLSEDSHTTLNNVCMYKNDLENLITVSRKSTLRILNVSSLSFIYQNLLRRYSSLSRKKIFTKYYSETNLRANFQYSNYFKINQRIFSATAYINSEYSFKPKNEAIANQAEGSSSNENQEVRTKKKKSSSSHSNNKLSFNKEDSNHIPLLKNTEQNKLSLEAIPSQNKIKIKIFSNAPKTKINKEFEDIMEKQTSNCSGGYVKKKVRFKHSYINIISRSPHASSSCSHLFLKRDSINKYNNWNSKLIQNKSVTIELKLNKTDNIDARCTTAAGCGKNKTFDTIENRISTETINVLYDKNRQINNLSKVHVEYTVTDFTPIECLQLGKQDIGTLTSNANCLLTKKESRSNFLASVSATVEKNSELTSRSTSLSNVIYNPLANSNLDSDSRNLYCLVSDDLSGSSIGQTQADSSIGQFESFEKCYVKNGLHSERGSFASFSDGGCNVAQVFHARNAHCSLGRQMNKKKFAILHHFQAFGITEINTLLNTIYKQDFLIDIDNPITNSEMTSHSSIYVVMSASDRECSF